MTNLACGGLVALVWRSFSTFFVAFGIFLAASLHASAGFASAAWQARADWPVNVWHCTPMGVVDGWRWLVCRWPIFCFLLVFFHVF
jgi:hypothetical protein